MVGWLDYHLSTQNHSNLNFYASSAVPLFTGCYNPATDTSSIERIFTHWQETGVFDHPGGIPSSLVQGSGQQWDYPNGWAPANHMFIEGLWRAPIDRMKAKARELAWRWVQSNHRVFITTGYMWEKYNVSGEIPSPGGGGKYRVEVNEWEAVGSSKLSLTPSQFQPGFGWSNGVILDLLTSGVLDGG